MTGPRINDNHKAKIDHDKKMAANYLFHEHKLPEDKIRRQLKMSAPLLDRMLIPTFKQWREFKERVGKV